MWATEPSRSHKHRHFIHRSLVACGSPRRHTRFSLLLTSVALASPWTPPPSGGLGRESGRSRALWVESNDVLRALLRPWVCRLVIKY